MPLEVLLVTESLSVLVDWLLLYLLINGEDVIRLELLVEDAILFEEPFVVVVVVDYDEGK